MAWRVGFPWVWVTGRAEFTRNNPYILLMATTVSTDVVDAIGK